MLIASYAVSQTVIHLAGPALLIPISWHVTTTFVSLFVGGIAFSFAAAHRHEITGHDQTEAPPTTSSDAAAADKDKDKDKPPHPRKPQPSIYTFKAGRRTILGCTVLMLLSLILYYLLTQSAVRHFDPATYLAGIRESHLALATTLPSEADHISTHANDLPRFINLEDSSILLPFWFPESVQQEIDRETKLSGTDGLQALMAEQPERVFDALNGPALLPQLITVIAILASHLAVVSSTTYLVGFLFDPVADLIGLVAGASVEIPHS